MGGTSGKALIRDYCKTCSTLTSDEDRHLVTKLFGVYDKKQEGFLDQATAIIFISDIFLLSGIKHELIAHTPSGSVPDQFVLQTIQETLKELAKDPTKLELSDVLAPRQKHNRSLVEHFQIQLKASGKIRDQPAKIFPLDSESSSSASSLPSAPKPTQDEDDAIETPPIVSTPSRRKTSSKPSDSPKPKHHHHHSDHSTNKRHSASKPAPAVETPPTRTKSSDIKPKTAKTTSDSKPTPPPKLATKAVSTPPAKVWEWQWQDLGKWIPYDAETNKILEDAYLDGQDQVDLNHGFFASQGGYSVMFSKMTQMRKSNSFVRKIQRVQVNGPAVTTTSKVPAPPLNNTKTAVTTPVTQPVPAGAGVWEYQDAEGNWKPFDRTSVIMMDGSAKQGRTNMTLMHPPWSQAGGVHIDFIEMKLKYVKTGDIVACKRNPPLNFIKPTEKKTTEKKATEPEVTLSSVGKGFKHATGAIKKKEVGEKETCPICLDTLNGSIEVIQMSKCQGHYFHTACIYPMWKRDFLKCPICLNCYGTQTGVMPAGSMKITTSSTKLEGTDCKGTITIEYKFSEGVQGPDHPNPGKRYSGTSRTCYLPETPEGREVLRLLKIAWERNLTFTVGQSVTAGGGDSVIWNGIHHKTQTTSGAYGYPDPTYLARVTEELHAKGVY